MVPAPAAPPSERQPTAPPPVSIGQLRKAVPPHCFRRALPRSLCYLLRDLAMAAALFYCATAIPAAPTPAWARRLLLWPAYWWAQGAVATGLWVLAHECGHQAFSSSQVVNDGLGLALHTLLLVPYFAWKHSHRRHHAATNCIEKDEVFVPHVRDAPHRGFELEQLFPVRVFRLLTTLTLGWPLYLIFNVASRPHKSRRWVSHFDPWAPLFSRRERVEVAASDACLAAWAAALAAAGRRWGWGALAATYGGPYLVMNFWLVVITMLQHTHPSLPHYREGEWAWLKGALATVDRSNGRALDFLHHHIADTHVAHHLFSQIPHYHAAEATRGAGAAAWAVVSAGRHARAPRSVA